MARLFFFKSHVRGPALIRSVWTAAGKAAPRLWIYRIGHLTFDDLNLLVLHLDAGYRNSREQSLCIRVHWIFEQLSGRRELHALSQIHDRDLIGNMAHHAEIMGNVIKAAEEAGVRDRVKIMIGGAPVTEEFAESIGADAYTPDATSAAEKALQLLG